jgi:hypothetical protein
MRNVSYRTHGENQNKHFMFNKLSRTILPFNRYVEKYVRAMQATDNNMAPAHFMLDN